MLLAELKLRLKEKALENKAAQQGMAEVTAFVLPPIFNEERPPPVCKTRGSTLSFHSDWARKGKKLVNDVEPPVPQKFKLAMSDVDPWVLALLSARAQTGQSVTVHRPSVPPPSSMSVVRASTVVDTRQRPPTEEFNEWLRRQHHGGLRQRPPESAGHFSRLVGACTDRNGVLQSTYQDQFEDKGLAWGWEDVSYRRKVDKDMELFAKNSSLIMKNTLQRKGPRFR